MGKALPATAANGTATLGAMTNREWILDLVDDPPRERVLLVLADGERLDARVLGRDGAAVKVRLGDGSMRSVPLDAIETIGVWHRDREVLAAA